MSRYTLVVLANATEGRDDEFNDWYNGTHLKDVLGVGGFVSAQRFQAVESDPAGPGAAYRYLAFYEIETDDIAKVQQEFNERAASGQIGLSTALDTSNVVVTYFEPITEEIAAGSL